MKKVHRSCILTSRTTRGLRQCTLEDKNRNSLQKGDKESEQHSTVTHTKIDMHRWKSHLTVVAFQGIYLFCFTGNINTQMFLTSMYATSSKMGTQL